MLKQETLLSQHSMSRARHVTGLLLGYLAAALSCLPIAYADSNPIIWERGDQIVRLVKQDDPSAPPNNHPVDTEPGELAAMLKTLQLRYADDASDAAPVSVFTSEEIANLGDAIATGLERAAPSDDVIFHVIGARRLSRGPFGKRNRVSAGRVFYRDGNINIIFGQVQTPYRKKNLYGQINEDFYPRNYGSRTAATKHDAVLLTDSATRLYQSGAGTRDDWIVIEPGAAKIVALPDDDTDPLPAAPTRASSTVPVERTDAPSIPAAPHTAADSDTRNGRPKESNAEATPSTADVEARLEALKRLRERELISEDAYETRMKEILQDL